MQINLVPEDIDVLFVVGRGSFSIPTNLPRERTVFCEFEPDAVNPRNTRFLNQFGIAITSSEEELKSEKRQHTNFRERSEGPNTELNKLLSVTVGNLLRNQLLGKNLT